MANEVTITLSKKEAEFFAYIVYYAAEMLKEDENDIPENNVKKFTKAEHRELIEKFADFNNSPEDVDEIENIRYYGYSNWLNYIANVFEEGN